MQRVTPRWYRTRARHSREGGNLVSFHVAGCFQSEVPRKALDPRVRGDDGEPRAGHTIRTTDKSISDPHTSPALGFTRPATARSPDI